ncbi:deoxyhypusine synthase [Candidatus Pacearchaeota archaeon]|nr:deoxyhypusine synthase [Candidatus Pacearchaeota archaeon]
MIEPLNLKGREKISDFIDNVYGNSGYNARNLADACKIFKKMIEDKDNTTICLTLAGAMTPIGMSGVIIGMMQMGFFDFIISTGANLYHDLHRPYNFPMKQGEVFVDDAELNDNDISRIYDVYIEDSETLMATDKVIIETLKNVPLRKPISTAEFHYQLGKNVWKTAPHPEKSILAWAYKLNIPIYTSSPGDSSIGMNLAEEAMKGKRVYLDPLIDITETTAFVGCSKKNGAIEIGGGSPKNFYMQTQPHLWQFLRIPRGGHDYFVQLTTDSPQWGGLSGATPQEAKSWGKIKKEAKTYAVVYSCASITFPLLCQYVRQECKPRKLKELYLKRKEFVKKIDEEQGKVKLNLDEFRELWKEDPKPNDFYD